MGEFVDDIRAALVMNPNFCRLRIKKEDAPKRNGYVKNEEATNPNNTIICSNVSIEDANGNVCLPMKELSYRKVTFKDDRKRLPLRRRASDIEMGEAAKAITMKENCEKCSPNVPDDTLFATPLDFKSSRIDDIEKLLRPSFEENSVEDMDLEGDSKYASSDTQSKDSSCDVEVQVSDTNRLGSGVLQKAVDFESSESTLPRNLDRTMSLDDILARYSSVLDESSLQILQRSSDSYEINGYTRRKPLTFVLIAAFILIPTFLFYFLVVLFYFQPEPFYSFLLKNLKLRNEPEISLMTSLIEFLNWISLELYDYAFIVVEDLIPNF